MENADPDGRLSLIEPAGDCHPRNLVYPRVRRTRDLPAVPGATGPVAMVPAAAGIVVAGLFLLVLDFGRRITESYWSPFSIRSN